MGRYRSRSRSRSRSYSPVRRKRYDEPRHRRGGRRSPEPSGLLVRNIALSSRPDDLRVPFERYGPIKDVYLPKNYHTGEPRGFGFVKFRYAEDAAEAKAHLNCTVIGGREIKIVFAEENRKTPQEMRKVLRTSGPSARGSYRRHSPSRFPSRRYHSYSRSASPARHDSRDRDRENHDDYYSPRRSRSKSRSISPRDERNCRSKGRYSRQSRRMSRSNSPHIQKKGRFSMSPRDNSQIAHDVDFVPRRLNSPGRNADSSARSRSRSYRDRDRDNHDDYNSPRRSGSKSRSISPRDERNCRSKGRSSRQSRRMSRSNSPHIQKKGRFSMSPRDNSQIAHDVDSAPRRLKSPGRNADNSARSRSRSYSR
ncbi:serine/arginine-rich SC35-like splicing factor SCL28 isoform X1 [Capsicum chacoense]